MSLSSCAELISQPISKKFDIASTEEILSELRAGRMIVLVDAEDRENEGDLLMAAQFVTSEAINFMTTYGRGLVCLTLTEAHCRRLNLSMMASDNRSHYGTNFTVSIEAAVGIGTGISAADRARTIQAAVAQNAQAHDLVQPGHIFPLRAVPGGVLGRAGHTEAGCDLTALAGLTPAAVICEILKPDGTMARLPDLISFSQRHGLKVGTIAHLVEYRTQSELIVERKSQRELATPWGTFNAIAYYDRTNQSIHLALTHGTIVSEQETLVRIHEPVSILDALDVSTHLSDWTIAHALQAIAQQPAGVMIIMNHFGSQDYFFKEIANWPKETVENTLEAKKVTSLRAYSVGAQILRDLKIVKAKLLACPNSQIPNMENFGLSITDYVTFNQTFHT